MKRKRALLLTGLILLACLGVALLLPSPGYTPGLVEPRLLALKTPYRSISTNYYLDGGSIGLSIIDRKGTMEQFAIPFDCCVESHYTRVFVGATHDRHPGAVTVADPEQTKRMLVHALDSMPHRTY